MPVFKKLVKSHVRKPAFKYLEGLKDGDNKVNKINIRILMLYRSIFQVKIYPIHKYPFYSH